jgi:proline iminopeptidase
MASLYPVIEPHDSGMLAVSELHRVYYQQSGRSDGHAVLFLHGGPGGGCQGWNRRLFDPGHYRVVLFDQRGCGRSQPHGSLVENTTWHLVADIERLRVHLGIERWLVFGGSWGSTLALAYAQQHPERVVGLILRGIFLMRPEDVRWFYGDGTRQLFPEAWQRFVEPIPEQEREDLVAAYYKRLVAGGRDQQMEYALSWTRWETATSRLCPEPSDVERVRPSFAFALARIESHYFVHGGWLRCPDQLLVDMPRIAHLPGIIVQGRYDAICPPSAAWSLCKAWPASQLQIVAAAGHSALEPEILSRLVAATDQARAWSTAG